jgi:hypothetical protein
MDPCTRAHSGRRHADRSDLLDRFLALLTERDVRWCVIGGQAVNAYVDPVVSLDLDLVVATNELTGLEHEIRSRFRAERFAHRLNIGAEGTPSQ